MHVKIAATSPIRETGCDHEGTSGTNARKTKPAAEASNPSRTTSLSEIVALLIADSMEADNSIGGEFRLQKQVRICDCCI